MAQLSILSGIYTDETADWRGSMPINKEPIFGQNGVSGGYLGQVMGVTAWASGYGMDRGGINWNGICYRVLGSSLVTVDATGVVTILADVGDDGQPCSLDYSFDRLGITSGNKLFYWNGTTLVQVTDPDLGPVFDIQFIDGVFMMTDGTYVVITDVNDPMAINPLRYGSAETDPDPILALCKIRGEAYALGQYTIQQFRDIGGAGFPYQTNLAGFIPRGIVGRKAWSYFLEVFAFVGCARREQPSVYLAGAGESKSISTQEVDKLLAALTPEQQAAIVMEQRNEQNEQRLYMHLPDRTLVYMNQASLQVGQPVWVTLREGLALDQPYRARNMVPAYGKWIVGSTDGQVGYLDDSVSYFFTAPETYQFNTNFLYNEGKGGILHRVELVGLPGRTSFGADPRIYISFSKDGITYGQEFGISAGKFGERDKRLVWWPNIRFSNYMSMRFRGEGASRVSFSRLEVDVEPLAA